MAQPAFQALKSTADIDALFERSREHPVSLFKHSTRCPVSSYAHREFLEYAAGAPDRGVECAMVLVVEDRPVSLELAERLGVRHASPQAILIRDGRAVWDESHEGITAEALRNAES